MVVVLTAISVIAGGVLAYVNMVTQEPIAEINAKNLQDGIKRVILGDQPGELKVEEPVEVDGFVLYQTDKGTAVKAVENGFGGPLEVLVGFDNDGNILGYTILATVETPGLGVKASTWFQKGQKGDIIGKNPGEKELTVSKDGGEIDAITASTITSRAFLNAVNKAYKAYKGQGADAQSGEAQSNVVLQVLDFRYLDARCGDDFIQRDCGTYRGFNLDNFDFIIAECLHDFILVGFQFLLRHFGASGGMLYQKVEGRVMVVFQIECRVIVAQRFQVMLHSFLFCAGFDGELRFCCLCFFLFGINGLQVVLVLFLFGSFLFCLLLLLFFGLSFLGFFQAVK